jgi:hypothetical protein
VIKAAMDTKSVIARFEAEWQAVAMMDHTNIAKVFDAGATEAGRPYFVIELVRGAKITVTTISTTSRPANAWRCSSRFVTRSSMLTKRESSIAI